MSDKKTKTHKSFVITLSLQKPLINVTKHKSEEIGPGFKVNWVIWFWIGLTFLFLSIILKITQPHDKPLDYLSHLCAELTRDLGIALVLASIIAKIIEVPTVINFVNERTIEALCDNNFLKSLKPPQLQVIKTQCSKSIFEQNGKRQSEQFLNESLVEYEENITRLLLQPYHEYYKVNIHCEDIILNDNNGKEHHFMKKIYKRHFKIVNPLLGNNEVEVISPFNIHCPENFTCEKLIELNKISIKIDKKEKENLKSAFTPLITDNGVKHPNYNSKIRYVQSNNNATFSFDSEIVVDIEETRYISHDDPIYVHRVIRPTKNFSIDYSYNNPKAKLKIEGFGADANLTDGNLIKIENGNTVSFEMLTWLLPGNGILVATIPLEKNEHGVSNEPKS